MQSEQLISILQSASANPPTGDATAQQAQIYYDLCQSTNTRLENCSKYIRRGMISEGLRIADAEPHLLDLCAKLDFVGVENWVQICKERKWPVAPALDAKAIEEINNAFTSGLILEPLLKEYRLAARTGNTRACIRTLKHLIAADGDGSTWSEDLRRFEEKRWTELRAEYERAKRQENPDIFAEMLVEINGEWRGPIDEELRSDVQNTVREVCARHALDEAQRIVKEIASAYSALNYEETKRGLDAYSRILVDGYLSPSAEMQLQVQEATEWCNGEKKKRDEKGLYEETIQRLRAAVEAGQCEELDEILNILTRYEYPIPDRLEVRAKALLEDHKVATGKRRTRYLISIGAFAILALLGIAGYVARNRMAETLSTAALELERSYNAEELSVFTATIETLKTEHPKLFNRQEIQAWATRAEKLRGKVQAKNVAFDAAVEQLELLRTEGYQGDANRINALIQLALENALSGEKRGKIAVIEREWEAHQLKIQGENDRVAKESVEALEKECAPIIENADMQTPAQDKRIQDHILVIEDKKKEHHLASDAIKSRFDILMGRLEATRDQATQKRRQYEEILRAGTIDQYLESLATYLRAFPNDLRAEVIKPIVTNTSLYKQFVEIPQGAGSENVVWGREVKAVAEQTKIVADQWPEVKNALISLEYEKRYVEIWQCKHREGGMLYFEGRPEKSVSSTGLPEYRGLMYRPRTRDVQPKFSLQTIEARNISDVELMPHCEFVQGLISIGRFSDPEHIKRQLRQKMQALHEASTIGSLLKLRMMDVLAGYYEKLIVPEETINWTAFRRELQSVDPELHWLCIEHHDVKMASDRAKRILDTWFQNMNYVHKLDLNDELQDVALRRRIRWAGFTSIQNPLQVQWENGEHPDEVWVIRSGSGLPKTYLAEEVIRGERKRYVKYMPAEPVFAPSEKRTTRQILNELKGKFDISTTDGIAWPLSWPNNFRK